MCKAWWKFGVLKWTNGLVLYSLFAPDVSHGKSARVRIALAGVCGLYTGTRATGVLNVARAALGSVADPNFGLLEWK